MSASTCDAWPSGVHPRNGMGAKSIRVYGGYLKVPGKEREMPEKIYCVRRYAERRSQLKSGNSGG